MPILRRLALLEHAILAVLGFVTVAPFLWMIATSLKAPDKIFGAPLDLVPDGLAALDNYSRAFTTVPMLQFIANGVIVVFGILFVQVLTALFAAYALAKLEFRGRGLLLGCVIFGLCIPVQVPALPLYLGIAAIGALDTYFALMAPFFLSVFAIFLFRQFFRGFPDEVIQAARLDGFTEMEIVLRLILPSARPAIAAFSVFSLTAHWNDLYWPMIVVSSLDRATPPLGMMFFTDSEFSGAFGPLMAGAAIVTLPLVGVFLAAQRQFIRGITMTGLK